MKVKLHPLRFAALLVIVIFFYQCDALEYIRSQEETASGRESSTSVSSKEQMLREELVSVARKQLGRPYKYGGKDPRGFDCSGLTYYAYRQIDVELAASSRYQAEQGRKLGSVGQAREGDLVFFSSESKGGGRINHVALVVSNTSNRLRIVHSTSRGVVEEVVQESSYWNSRVLFARDIFSGL